MPLVEISSKSLTGTAAITLNKDQDHAGKMIVTVRIGADESQGAASTDVMQQTAGTLLERVSEILSQRCYAVGPAAEGEIEASPGTELLASAIITLSSGQNEGQLKTDFDQAAISAASGIDPRIQPKRRDTYGDDQGRRGGRERRGTGGRAGW
jgi:hypothetical protein